MQIIIMSDLGVQKNHPNLRRRGTIFSFFSKRVMNIEAIKEKFLTHIVKNSKNLKQYIGIKWVNVNCKKYGTMNITKKDIIRKWNELHPYNKIKSKKKINKSPIKYNFHGYKI